MMSSKIWRKVFPALTALVASIIVQPAPATLLMDDMLFGGGACATSSTATWNSSDSSANITLSNGNLTTTSGNTTDKAVRGTTSHGPSGNKYYVEHTVGATYGGGDTGPGLATAGANLASLGVVAANAVIVYPAGLIYFNGAITAKAIPAITPAGTVVGMAIDLANNKIWMRKNGGDWFADAAANPVTNTNGLDISAVFGANAAYPVQAFGAAGSNGATITANFGATAYAFTAPTGFCPW